MIRCFGNWTQILAFGALLGACGDAAQTGPTAQSGTSSRVDPSPIVRARWVAVVDAQSLAVVRFDDPLAPKTIPVVPMAAAGATDAASVTIVETLVAWSPDGERLAFVTQEATSSAPSAMKLWVAARTDDFAPREIPLPSDVHFTEHWIGDDALAVRLVRNGSTAQESVEIVRARAPDWTVESLAPRSGENGVASSGASVFTPSRYGVLYDVGSAGAAQLMVARAEGEPRRLGGVPAGARFDLTWSTDGQSATWWTAPPGNTSELCAEPNPATTWVEDPPPGDRGGARCIAAD